VLEDKINIRIPKKRYDLKMINPNIEYSLTINMKNLTPVKYIYEYLKKLNPENKPTKFIIKPSITIENDKQSVEFIFSLRKDWKMKINFYEFKLDEQENFNFDKFYVVNTDLFFTSFANYDENIFNTCSQWVFSDREIIFALYTNESKKRDNENNLVYSNYYIRFVCDMINEEDVPDIIDNI
jgi:hypothetical protein